VGLAERFAASLREMAELGVDIVIGGGIADIGS